MKQDDEKIDHTPKFLKMSEMVKFEGTVDFTTVKKEAVDGHSLDVSTGTVDKLMNGLSEQERGRVLNSFFTATGLPVAETDGNALYAENDAPPQAVLKQRRRLDVELLDCGVVDGWRPVFWMASEVGSFGVNVAERLRQREDQILLFVRLVRVKDACPPNAPRPGINAFLKQGGEYRFGNRFTREVSTVLVVESSASMITGAQTERATHYVLLEIISTVRLPSADIIA